MRMTALTAALAGAIAWVTNLYVHSDALSLAGTVLLGVAVLVVGSGLARERWLAVITAAGAVTLAWSLLVLLRHGYPDRVLEGVLGGLAGLVVAVAVARAPRGTTTPVGNHRG